MSNNTDFDLVAHQKLTPFVIEHATTSRNSLKRGLRINWGKIKTVAPSKKVITAIGLAYEDNGFALSAPVLGVTSETPSGTVELWGSDGTVLTMSNMKNDLYEAFKLTEDGDIKATGPTTWGAATTFLTAHGLNREAIINAETYEDEDGKIKIKSQYEPVIFYLENLE